MRDSTTRERPTAEIHSLVEPLAAEWEELAEQTKASPFRRPGWIVAWWRALGKGALEILTIRRDGRLVAVLPLGRQFGALSSTTNWHTPDFGPVIQDPPALRALAALWQASVGEEAMSRLGAKLGADLAACLYGRAAWVGGIGERIDPAADLPQAGILLANPRRELPTAAVFAARNGPFGEAGRGGSVCRRNRTRRDASVVCALLDKSDVRRRIDRLRRAVQMPAKSRLHPGLHARSRATP